RESCKETPDATLEHSRKCFVFFVQKLSFCWSWLAHEVSDQWRKYPDDEERAYLGQCARLKTQRESERGNCEYQRRQHESNERLQIVSQRSFRFGRRDPLEQLPSRD